jgi:N-acetylglutamate synthase-like GNAT family acetyltransferase
MEGLAPFEISSAKSKSQKGQLDALLWDALWSSLGLPRNARETFALEGDEIALIAMKGQICVGGLVGVIINEEQAKIRHLAVQPAYQKQKVGSALVSTFMQMMAEKNTQLGKTVARNASEPFFKKLGFRRTSDKLEHPNFARQDIHFYEMQYEPI